MTALVIVLLLQITPPDLPGSWELGAYAYDTDTGEVLLDINGGVPFRPASTVKALTALAALEYLGPEYVYHTSILADTAAGNLVLRGSGAPLLSAEDVARTAMETAALLPVDSRWNLYLDTGDFMGDSHLPGWDRNDWNRTYCPPVEPLCIGDNVIQIVVSATGGDIRVFTYPPLPSLAVNSSALARGNTTSITASGGNWETGLPEITLSGTIKSGTREIIYKPFAGAPLELALVLQTELARHGLDVIYRGIYPDSGQDPPFLVASVMYSDPLWVILGSMNKWSRNMVAEQVLRTTALEAAGSPGSTRAGCDVSGALLESICPGETGWQLADGSGLSRHNLLTARQLATVFHAGASSLEYGPEFLAGFPVNGVDGTLRTRMTGIPQGAFRGKTGSLNDTCTITGILTTESGRSVTLALFLQIPGGQLWRARSWQDGFIESLYEAL